MCAGVAGLLISSNVKSADGNNAGQLLELDAILAVTLGGTALTGGRFSLVGSVIGALIIQTLTYAIYSLGVPPEINLVVKAVVVFVVMLLQSAEFRASVRQLVRRPAPGAPHERAPCRMPPRSRCGQRAGASAVRASIRKYLPLAATISLFVAMATLGSVLYDGFFSAQVFLNLLIDNAFLMHRRGRHDLRDPVGRHRPVGGLGDRADHHGLGLAGRAPRLEPGAS